MAKDIKLHISGIDTETGGRFIKFPENINDLISMNNLLDIYGEIPLPPYIKVPKKNLFMKIVIKLSMQVILEQLLRQQQDYI